MSMKILAKNKKSLFDYEIIETFEAGMVLLGPEVKGVKSAQISIKESFVSIEDGKVILKQSHITIPEYANQNLSEVSPTKERLLLLNKSEIKKIKKAVTINGFTIIPLSVYTNDRGLIKISIAIAKGLKKYDKRVALKEKDLKRFEQQFRY